MTISDDFIGKRRFAALAAAVAMNMVFGSLYAWSVFIAGLEADLGIMRTDVSIVFSLAIVCFTTGNFLAPFTFGRIPSFLLPLLPAMTSAGGLAMAAMGTSYVDIVIGYGVLFGFSCGFAYNVGLQSALMAAPDRPGLINGIVIASFAAGSIIAAYLLSLSVAEAGVRATFWMVALAAGGTCVAGAVLLFASGIRLPLPPAIRGGDSGDGILGTSWLGFFLGSLAGVMSIGHAAAIITHFGGTAQAAVTGVTLLGLGNAVGRLGGGWLTDHMSVRSVAGISHLVGILGFVIVLANPTGEGATIAMCMAGLSYGINAGVYPSAISIFLGRAAYGRNFALLLTAWGAAGLSGPFIGGYLYDLTSDYRIALEMACVVSILALVNAMRLPRSRQS